MNRELLVTLLRKDIQELGMMTDGFMEMNAYPKAIMQLAGQKISNIQFYITQLNDLEPEIIQAKEPQTQIQTPIVEPIVTPEEPIETEHTIDFGILEKIESPEIEVTVTEEKQATVTATSSEISTYFKEVDSEEKATVFSRNELLSKNDNSIGSVMANKKIADIKLAITIGDRFRFQRELFKSNGEDMNKTLHYINQLATLDEALSFLQSKYNWGAENDAVEDFYQIVKRRFL